MVFENAGRTSDLSGPGPHRRPWRGRAAHSMMGFGTTGDDGKGVGRKADRSDRCRTRTRTMAGATDLAGALRAGLRPGRLAAASPVAAVAERAGAAGDAVGRRLLAAAALLLALCCFALFALRRTTILPDGRPSALVLRGPYRFTRNPMYVSLVLSYVAWPATWWCRGPWSCCRCRFGLAAGADPIRGSAPAPRVRQRL